MREIVEVRRETGSAIATRLPRAITLKSYDCQREVRVAPSAQRECRRYQHSAADEICKELGYHSVRSFRHRVISCTDGGEQITKGYLGGDARPNEGASRIQSVVRIT